MDENEFVDYIIDGLIVNNTFKKIDIGDHCFKIINFKNNKKLYFIYRDDDGREYFSIFIDGFYLIIISKSHFEKSFMILYNLFKEKEYLQDNEVNKCIEIFESL